MSLWRPVIASDALGVERSMRQMQNAMNSMFGDLFVGGPLDLDSSSLTSRHNALTGFSPRVDIKETSKEFDIKADLPGLSKNSVKLEVHDGSLWISGETAKETERDEGRMHIRERFQGNFRRAIPLPPTANTEHIKAKFEDGVLSIGIPKQSPEESGAKMIAIQ